MPPACQLPVPRDFESTVAIYQMAGFDSVRWGSFASSALPLAVRVPETTQLFDPLIEVCSVAGT